MMPALNFCLVDPPKNTFYGYVDLELQPSGLALHDCALHRNGDARWVALPGRPQIDRDGRVIKEPKTGKSVYAAVVEIEDRAARERFQAAALAAVDKLLGL